jgi:hypothetical protein
MGLAGCGGTKSDSAGRSACIQRAVDRAVDRVVAQAYGAHRLGSPAQVRSEIRALGHQPGYTVTPFLTADGALIQPAQMSDAAHLTFTTWWRNTKPVATVLGNGPDEAGVKAAADAKSSCS